MNRTHPNWLQLHSWMRIEPIGVPRRGRKRKMTTVGRRHLHHHDNHQQHHALIITTPWRHQQAPPEAQSSRPTIFLIHFAIGVTPYLLPRRSKSHDRFLEYTHVYMYEYTYVYINWCDYYYLFIWTGQFHSSKNPVEWSYICVDYCRQCSGHEIIPILLVLVMS